MNTLFCGTEQLPTFIMMDHFYIIRVGIGSSSVPQNNVSVLFCEIMTAHLAHLFVDQKYSSTIFLSHLLRVTLTLLIKPLTWCRS